MRAHLVLECVHLPIFDLLSHCQERLLDIGGVLGRSLQEGNGQLVCKFLQGTDQICMK